MAIRPLNRGAEAWLWILAGIIAGILCLTLATALGAEQTDGQKPGLLPTTITDWAVPMPLQDATVILDDDTLRCEVWNVLEMHRTGEYEAAIAAWNRLTLPGETEVWKWIALGQAATATERLEEAEEFLDRAIEAQPENAVAYYFRGILRLQQAHLAWDWDDTPRMPHMKLVGFTGPRIVPNTKCMYELAATHDFERAIEFAQAVRLDEALVPATNDVFAAYPRVGDLLVALQADKFEAKAHNCLAYMFLDRGALDLAEQHLDDAVGGGLDVAYGYRDLGDEYHKCGRHADAIRAYLKPTTTDGKKTGTLIETLRCLRELMLGQ